MATALEDIRARLDRRLGRAPATVPAEAPTLESLKARVDRGMGRVAPVPRRKPLAQQGQAAPTLEGLKARIRAAKEVQGEQEPYQPEPPQEPFAHRPRGPRPTMRRPDASAPVEVDDPQSLTRSALHGIAQGAAGGLAGFPEVVGIQRQKKARGLLEQFDKIDRGEMPDPEYRASPGPVPAMDYLTANAETRQRMRDEATAAIRPIAEEPAYQVGQRIRQSTFEAFPIPEEHEGRFPVQLGRGVGSTATFLATGVAGRLAKLPVLAVTAGTGATVNAAQTFRDAVDFGASFEDAYEAAKLSAVVGTSEALPIVRLLDRFDKATGGQIKRLIFNAAKGGIEEGAQELFQSVAENLIASDLVAYDPEREMFTGSGDAAGVGFTVGALFNTLAGMLGVRVRAGRPKEAAPEPIDEQLAPGAVLPPPPP